MTSQTANGTLDGTHDPRRQSWVASANDEGSDFPIQNLPLGIFTKRGEEPRRAGVAIGDHVLELQGLLSAGLLTGDAAHVTEAIADGTLNGMFALPARFRRELRRQLANLLDEKQDPDTVKSLSSHLIELSDCNLCCPVQIRDYTDFFAGIYHAEAVGKLLHKDGEALPENYHWLPIAYHGRASSVVISGTAVRRPRGLRKDVHGEISFGPSYRLDLELEMGFFVGPGNTLGSPVPISKAASHICGFCLLNDWSARDIQQFEMVPLGPFLGKSFGTTISSWVVTPEALAPFRAPAMARDEFAQQPDYLLDELDQASGALDVELSVSLSSEKMRLLGLPEETLITSNARYLYWSPAQMVAHHTVGGCNLSPGDLLGTGTISGPRPDQLSSLLELTAGGEQLRKLSSGENRSFLEDGDVVTLRGRCERAGFRSIGFGDCTGEITAAPEG